MTVGDCRKLDVFELCKLSQTKVHKNRRVCFTLSDLFNRKINIL